MIRAVSLVVVLALTGPGAGVLACELVLCAGSRHDAAAAPDDCHESATTHAGPSWSATSDACHDTAAAIEAVVPAGASLLILPPAEVGAPGRRAAVRRDWPARVPEGEGRSIRLAARHRTAPNLILRTSAVVVRGPSAG